MENVFYVRNWRPNAIMFKYAGLKYLLERRGDRKDTVALPLDAKSDPTIARWLRNKRLEEITMTDYMELATRSVDGPFGRTKSRANDINIPMDGKDPITPTPYTIDSTLLNSEAWKGEYLSPSLEYERPPLSTSEEVAQTQEIADLKAKELLEEAEVKKAGRPRKVEPHKAV